MSFDDFDRFKKVPIGMSYTSMPSPFSKNKTYGKELEDIFLEKLSRLDIYPEIIYQTEQYKSGRYDEKIILAMDKRNF